MSYGPNCESALHIPGFTPLSNPLASRSLDYSSNAYSHWPPLATWPARNRAPALGPQSTSDLGNFHLPSQSPKKESVKGQFQLQNKEELTPCISSPDPQLCRPDFMVYISQGDVMRADGISMRPSGVLALFLYKVLRVVVQSTSALGSVDDGQSLLSLPLVG